MVTWMVTLIILSRIFVVTSTNNKGTWVPNRSSSHGNITTRVMRGQKLQPQDHIQGKALGPGAAASLLCWGNLPGPKDVVKELWKIQDQDQGSMFKEEAVDPSLLPLRCQQGEDKGGVEEPPLSFIHIDQSLLSTWTWIRSKFQGYCSNLNITTKGYTVSNNDLTE